MADECPTPKMRCGQNEIAKSSFRFLMAKLQLKIVRLLCQIVINTGGGPTPPAPGNPTEPYIFSDRDESNPLLKYYGFLDKEEAYYIMEFTPTTARYYAGTGLANYIADWAGRGALTYDYASQVF